MSNCQIRFQYNQVNVIIQCQRNELMRDIIIRYGTKSMLPVEQFYFLYGGNKINPDLTLNQINDKDNEILVLVYLKENCKNKEKMKESDFIKCTKSTNPAIVEFSNDYCIILSDGKHARKKIKLQEYKSTQMIDQSKIKCSICSKSKLVSYQSKFYYCFECNKNLCPECQFLHKEHKNIVDYSLKYFRCPQHKNQNFICYCLNCKTNLCIICKEQHKEHDKIDFINMFKKQNKKYIEKIQKVKELVDSIIDSLKIFEENLDVYMQINEKIKKNLLNMNVNYEIYNSMKNFVEMSFLERDIDQIINSNDINERFKKIMKMYKMMNNEITIKIKIEKNDIGKSIYFLDNTNDFYKENGKYVNHKHDNLREIKKINTTLFINGEKVRFKKSFIPKKSGIYLIKFLFNDLLSNCSYMFYNCKNIVEIDFSKFNTENVTKMQYMFNGCSELELLDLKSFNTERVTNMDYLFYDCKSLKSLDLQSFKTNNVINMKSMFAYCSSLTTLNLSSFNNQNVTNMESLFDNCSSLSILDLSTFNTQNVTNMSRMFCGCSSLTSLDLFSFNTQKVNCMKSLLKDARL